ncbi:MAG: DUF1579 domain-containing protein [Planctomycetota bacterium]|nr:MAG: DUF1579 domain-containing protein [Planctomycetota bacterium]
MQSRLSLFLAGAALVAGTAFVTAQIVRAQQDPAQDPAAAIPPEMMEKMQELATPGPEHADLQKLVGEWNQSYTMKWSEDMPEMASKGTAKVKPLLGGRFVMEEVHMELPGMGPMEGISILGYDKLKGEYVSIWMDSWSTWPTFASGKAGKDGKIETKGTMVDAMAGARPFRMVIQPKSDNEHYAEMFDTIDGKEVKVMTIHAKRK